MPEATVVPLLNQQQGSRSTQPTDIEDTVHEEILSHVFQGNIEIGYGRFWKRIQEIALNMGIDFGDNRAKDYVTYYLRKGWIKKENRRYSQGP